MEIKAVRFCYKSFDIQAGRAKILDFFINSMQYLISEFVLYQLFDKSNYPKHYSITNPCSLKKIYIEIIYKRRGMTGRKYHIIIIAEKM